MPVQGNTASIDHLIRDVHKGGRPGSANLFFQCNLRTYEPLDSAPKQPKPFDPSTLNKIPQPLQKFKAVKAAAKLNKDTA